MTFGSLGCLVKHDVIGEAFLVARASETKLTLQVGDEGDGGLVTVEAREVQGTLAADVVTGVSSSSSAKTSAGVPRPNRKKIGPRATSSAALSSAIQKPSTVTKEVYRQIKRRKQREATAAAKGKPLKPARAEKNRTWEPELKAQAVTLYHARYAVGNQWAACAKKLEEVPGFQGVKGSHVRGWVMAAAKVAEQEPNEYGLVVTARGRKPMLTNAVYQELAEQLALLARTQAFTINSTSLRPIVLAFVVEKLGLDAIRPGRGGFICGPRYLRLLAHAAGLKWRKPFGDARKHPRDAAKQIDDMILRLAYLMHEHDVPPALVLNFDHSGAHFMQMRGNTWTEVEEDNESQHFSRQGKQKEVKQQGKNDKRQGTITVGTSMAGDVLPGQLICEGEPTSRKALPTLDGNKYVKASGNHQGHAVGHKLARDGADVSKGQLTRTWLGHLVQTNNHWANIKTSYAILEYIIVPWLLEKKKAIGKSADAVCILIVDCWYGWKDQDKKKTLISFRHYVRNHYPWLRLIYVPAACTDLAQPADRGMISWLKAVMRTYYTNIISADVTQQIKAGTPVGQITLNTKAPYLKAMLANAFAKALSELPKEKVVHCWAPLMSAWEKKEELHTKAKEELTRLFPNHVLDVGPTATEPEPDPVITTTDDFEVDDDTETTNALYQDHYANMYALGFRLVVS